MNIINLTNVRSNRIMGWLPPTRRTLTFDGQSRFLALPYQIIYFDQVDRHVPVTMIGSAKTIESAGYFTPRIMFTQTEPTPDTPLVGLPLPCVYDTGHVCNTFVNYQDKNDLLNNLKAGAVAIFQSDWSTSDGYPWSQRYTYKNEFVTYLQKKTRRKGEDIPTILGMWEKVSKKDPNFILTVPLLKPTQVKTVQNLFTNTKI